MDEMNINYNNRKFCVLSNSESGEISEGLIFHYKQDGNILTCSYSGGEIIEGNILGIVENNGRIKMKYHQVNSNGFLRSGSCTSIPEIMDNGRIKIHEEWEWADEKNAKGTSILIEVD